MLSLWKLRVGVEAYYLAQVASGLDEYYTGAGEAPGQWVGTSGAALGLTGAVAGEELRAVLAGLAPGTALTPNGDRLHARPRRVPGFDLTFSVPKSVSVVYALGDPLVQGAVVEGCEAALAEALAWLEREACFVRRGTNNRAMAQRDDLPFGTRRMVAEGFVAAQFRHRTSRTGDPHLHWHVLVGNLARGIDGRWSALDGTALYGAKRTAGVVFQAAMRRELTERLGVEWGPAHRDAADIAGVPARVLREFSTRHEQIAEWLESTGQEGPAAATDALLATRTRKQVPTDAASIDASWRTRAEAVGWGPEQLDVLLCNSAKPTRADDGLWIVREPVWSNGAESTRTRAVSFDEWLEWLLTTRATATSGTFTRYDLASAVAGEVAAVLAPAQIDAIVQRCLASPLVVPVEPVDAMTRHIDGPDRTVPDDREQHFTARSLLRVEAELLHRIGAGLDAGIGVLDPVRVATGVSSSTLGPDQQGAVESLASSGDAIAVLVGRAGTGKTHALGTIRDVYEQDGWAVVGLAPSARAARELESGAGIASTTIARHLVEQRAITDRTVLVMDEAGMAGTRDLARIVEQAMVAGAKVILVGDHHQLPEVAAGGAFRAAIDLLGDRAVELTINRRQQQPWEQVALDQLRHGDVPTAFAAYRDHGRVVIADDPADLHALAVADWDTARNEGETLLLAGTRSEARLLNRQARERLVREGRLDATAEVEFAGRRFAHGDQVVLCRNHPGQHDESGERFAVHNGMRGTIGAVTDEWVLVELTTGERVRLDRDYLDHGWVDHGYALTVHKAQGVTCDHVLVVGPAGLYREGAYVALSRARHSAHLYATADQATEIDERHALGIPLPTETVQDPEADLVARLHVSGAKTLVSIDDPGAAAVAQLADEIPATRLRELARHARRVEQSLELTDPAAARTDLDRAIAARTHLATGRRVRATDRDNVGHVIAIDDQAGTCVVHFENEAGHSATKSLTWSQLVVIDHPDPVEIGVAAQTALDRLTSNVTEAEAAWESALAREGLLPGDAERYTRALRVSEERDAHGLRGAPPEWLTTWIGIRPDTAAAATVWDDAVARIARYRLHHDIAEDVPGLGDRPSAASDAARWRQLMLRVLEDRCWLRDHHPAQPAPTVTPLSAAQLVDRRQELEQLMATAPPDQRDLIDRLSRSRVDPVELHQHLVAAMQIQDARREWIIANWPHLVELEQVNQVLATRPPLAHWPTELPGPVRDVLDQLRQLAVEPAHREERTLAELEYERLANDPVRALEQRIAHLQRLGGLATTEAERDVLDHEIDEVSGALRAARSNGAIDRAIGSYASRHPAESRRLATLTFDALTSEPDWAVDCVRSLHDSGALAALPAHHVLNHLTRLAAHLDQHGHLPPTVFPVESVAQVMQPL